MQQLGAQTETADSIVIAAVHQAAYKITRLELTLPSLRHIHIRSQSPLCGEWEGYLGNQLSGCAT